MPPESWSGYWFSKPVSPTSSTICCARAVRSGLDTPLTSRPNATFSMTRRCESRPKCWKTMATVPRRSARSSSALAPVTSRPAIVTFPAVGSIRRTRVRTSVDLPEPERPITTNTSPGQTSKLTSRTAVMHPVFSRSSERERSASGVPMILSAWGPKTFQTSSTVISGSRVRSTRSDTLGTTASLTVAAGAASVTAWLRERSERGLVCRVRDLLAGCPTPVGADFRRACPQASPQHTVRCLWNRRQAPDSTRSSLL